MKSLLGECSVSSFVPGMALHWTLVDDPDFANARLESFDDSARCGLLPEECGGTDNFSSVRMVASTNSVDTNILE